MTTTPTTDEPILPRQAAEASSSRGHAGPLHVPRWPTELPLLCLVVLVALGVWALLAVTVFGLLYVGLIGVFVFLSHVVFIAHIRGSAVRLGPSQLPDLHARVVELSHRAGLDAPPETYVQSAGGSLNAFATKFFRSHIVVLYSDLLEACGDDEAARDMVIGHELGHHRSGHLRFNWLLLPGLVMPFIGSAYSRAREYTCDRYGKALCGDRDGALRGLIVLAAGGRLGRRVDVGQFIEQSRSLESSWMTLGRWLSFYPQLCERVDALQRDLDRAPVRSARGTVGALAILAAMVGTPIVLGVVAFALLAALGKSLEGIAAAAADLDPPAEHQAPSTADGLAKVQEDFATFEAHLRELQRRGGSLPADAEELYQSWSTTRPGEAPLDPFDGLEYGVVVDGRSYRIWSSGPDTEPGTADDPSIDVDLSSAPRP
ncbi:MAG: peptidase M48 [Acidobacteria bacterium]|nr:MAG: peptidase M48 [Acidobacteriota bacterium]REJ99468.1 MAG: peptidase M48 [Acidobacteriota bacterium]